MHKLTRSYPEPQALVNARTSGATEWDAYWSGRGAGKESVQFDLLLMQHEKCAYCECALDLHQGHIEHFRRKKPDEWFPQLTFVWENLYYSCCRNGTCGCHKDRVLSRDDVDLLIDPCVDNPEDFIQFTYDGGVDIRSGLDELKTRRAKLTISTFGLPNPKLVELRRNALKAYEWLKALSSDQIDDYLANLPDTTPFITAIYHYFGKKYVS